MSFLKKIFDFYINSSIQVAIEVCCFVGITCLRFDIEIDPTFMAFVFFGTVTGYNFIKYAGTAGLRHMSLTKNMRLIQLFSFSCFVVLVYFSLQLALETLLWIGFFGLFTIFYAVPIFPNKKNLRSLRGLKIFVIALVVAGLTVIVPLIHHELSVGAEAWWVFVQRVAFIIAVIIPFEIRDLDFDASELGTIPQQMGEKNAKFLALVLLLVFLGIEFLKTNSLPEIVSAVAISIVSLAFIVFSTPKQSPYYASFWVEAIPIFWFLIFWSLTHFLL